ncbi:MAG TPA: adenylosuccinate lyase, partial [Isoptericola sp.]|nr:adenylosuccinate lyase [Isoptericola sp.]
MNLADVTPPIALGPLDGRYRAAVAPLVDHLSEAALNRARIHVEVEWLVTLCNGTTTTPGAVVPGAPTLTDAEIAYLRRIPATFGADEIAELAAIERETVHDVKAVEYFIKRRIAAAPEVLGETSLPAAS